MQPTQTGIATALALAVVLFFFIFGGFALFTPASAPAEANITFDNDNDQTMTTPANEGAAATNLEATDETVGTGATAEPGDTITVNYVGAFTNGTVFDASANHGDQGFTFQLGAGKVIQGWDQGIVGMKEGGKRRLIVPSSLGYGPNDYGPIPGNSTLLFEVELVKVVKAQ